MLSTALTQLLGFAPYTKGMYAIRSSALLFRDTPERIDFHVKSGDYIALVATVMGFLQEGLERCPASKKEHELAADLLKDLRHVHKHYRIVPKEDQPKAS